MTIAQQAHQCAAIIGNTAMHWLLAGEGEHVPNMQEAAEAYSELYESGLELVAQVAAYSTYQAMKAGGAPTEGNVADYLQQLSDIANSDEAEDSPVVMTKEMQHLEKCLSL